MYAYHGCWVNFVSFNSDQIIKKRKVSCSERVSLVLPNIFDIAIDEMCQCIEIRSRVSLTASDTYLC